MATEDLVYMLEEAGFDTGIKLSVLKKAVDISANIIGQPLGGSIYQWLLSQEKLAHDNSLVEPHCL